MLGLGRFSRKVKSSIDSVGDSAKLAKESAKERVSGWRAKKQQWGLIRQDAKEKGKLLREQEAEQKAKFGEEKREWKMKAKMDAQEMKFKARQDARQAKLEEKYMKRMEFHKNLPTNSIKLVMILLVVFAVGVSLYFAAPVLQDHYLFRQIFEGSSGVSSNVENAASGMVGPLNIMKQVLTGSYDPESVWKSKEVQSEYVVVEDAGVIVENIDAARTTFFTGSDNDELEIIGEVTIVSLFFDQQDEIPFKINVNVGACSQGATGTVAEKISGKVISDDWCDEKWVCDIPGEKRFCENPDGTSCEGYENIFNITRAYNKFFSCTHSGLTSKKASATLEADVKWYYDSLAVSGKQVFVASDDALAKYPDLADQFNIDKDTLKSWSISDGTVDLAIGMAGDKDFLRTTGDEATREVTHQLGISLKNDKAGSIHEIHDLVLILPHDSRIHVEEDGRYFVESGDPYPYSFNDEETTFMLQNYTLKDKWKTAEEISAGQHATYYLTLSIDEDYLGRTFQSSFQSFFVKTTLNYEYSGKKSTTIHVKVNPFEEADAQLPDELIDGFGGVLGGAGDTLGDVGGDVLDVIPGV